MVGVHRVLVTCVHWCVHLVIVVTVRAGTGVMLRHAAKRHAPSICGQLVKHCVRCWAKAVQRRWHLASGCVRGVSSKVRVTIDAVMFHDLGGCRFGDVHSSQRFSPGQETAIVKATKNITL